MNIQKNEVILCVNDLNNAIWLCQCLYSDINVKHIAIDNPQLISLYSIYRVLYNFINSTQHIVKFQNFSAIRNLIQFIYDNIDVFNQIENIDIALNTMLDIVDDMSTSNTITIEKMELLNFIISNIQDTFAFKQTFEYFSTKDITFISLQAISDYAKEYTIIYDINVNHAALPKDYNMDTVLNLSTYNMYYYAFSPERYNILQNFIATPDKDKLRGFIIGMSYIQRGTNLARFKYPTASLAAPTQDLFYDFEMLKFAHNNGANNLDFCIIEVNPYKLWYDMSLSKVNQLRSIYYIPQTGTAHHLPDNTKVEAFFDAQYELYNQLFEKDYLNQRFNQMHSPTNSLSKPDTNILASSSDDAYHLIKDEVTKLFDKDYPLTYEENKDILHNISKYLSDRNVHTIFVMPPFPKIFRDHMTHKMYHATLDLFHELNNTYPDSSVLDYTSCELFDDYYFSDGTHLNYFGSNLLTDLLNYELEKILQSRT